LIIIDTPDFIAHEGYLYVGSDKAEKLFSKIQTMAMYLIYVLMKGSIA